MEHHAQSVDDALIGGLSYKLKAWARYVTNRRSLSYFASGGNQYSPSGVRVVKFSITGDQWLDPSTFRVRFQLNNMDYTSSGTKYIKPLSWNPAVFFRRARIIAGGVVIEDIDGFNRLLLMLTTIMPHEKQLMIASEGFGSFDDRYAVVADDIVKNIVVVILINLVLFFKLVVFSLNLCSVFCTKINYLLFVIALSKSNLNLLILALMRYTLGPLTVKPILLIVILLTFNATLMSLNLIQPFRTSILLIC